MYRFILCLIFLFFSPFSLAGECLVISYGPFDSSANASNACSSALGDSCSHNVGASRYSYYDWSNSNTGASGSVQGENYCATPLHEYSSRTTHSFYYLPGCPSGTQSIPGSGGYCACDNGGSWNYQTNTCNDPPPADDDFSDEQLDIDDSTNSGGSDNDFGGDGGSECNFAPEGCAPGDKPDRPEIGDIDAPDTSAPPPPDAVTTGEKTETNSDGTTTTTSTREWTETDGSTVKETIRETTNPDGSKTTEKVLERNSPNGSTATTTVKSETDSQGNVTISGTTQEKQTEKEGSASGGNTCDAAPSCNGDAIQCAILNQQWLTRCDKNSEYADSDCSAQPQCQGDVLLCAGLINEWQNRCSLQKGPSDAETFFKDRGFKTAEDYAAEGGIFGGGESTDVSTIADGVFSSRSSVSGTCPANIAFTAGNFGNFELSLEPFCMLAEEIYWLVLLSAYMTAAFIIFRSITN